MACCPTCTPSDTVISKCYHHIGPAQISAGTWVMAGYPASRAATSVGGAGSLWSQADSNTFTPSGNSVARGTSCRSPMASTGQAGTLMLVTHGRGLAQGVLQERHEGVGSLDAVATRLACVDYDVVDEHLPHARPVLGRSEEHTSELQSLMRI